MILSSNYTARGVSPRLVVVLGNFTPQLIQPMANPAVAAAARAWFIEVCAGQYHMGTARTSVFPIFSLSHYSPQSASDATVTHLCQVPLAAQFLHRARIEEGTELWFFATIAMCTISSTTPCLATNAHRGIVIKGFPQPFRNARAFHAYLIAYCLLRPALPLNKVGP